MRVVMDLRWTPTGRITGNLHVHGAGEATAFDGWLALMSLLERIAPDGGDGAPDGGDGAPDGGDGAPDPAGVQ
jgi:hypothetical protein